MRVGSWVSYHLPCKGMRTGQVEDIIVTDGKISIIVNGDEYSKFQEIEKPADLKVGMEIKLYHSSVVRTITAIADDTFLLCGGYSWPTNVLFEVVEDTLEDLATQLWVKNGINIKVELKGSAYWIWREVTSGSKAYCINGLRKLL